ncbi:unnamed protein product, partial [marine sediment metagenome]
APVDENGQSIEQGGGGIPVDTPTEEGKRPLAIEEGEDIRDKKALPRKHRLEEAEYKVPTPEEEEEEEEDSFENDVWG